VALKVEAQSGVAVVVLIGMNLRMNWLIVVAQESRAEPGWCQEMDRRRLLVDHAIHLELCRETIRHKCGDELETAAVLVAVSMAWLHENLQYANFVLA